MKQAYRLKDVRGMMRNDIPVRADFRMVPV